MKQNLLKKLLLLIFTAFILSSCGDSNSNDPQQPEEKSGIVSSTKIGEFSPEMIAALVGQMGMQCEPQCSVSVYKVDYYSSEAKRNDIVCSGIICIPKVDSSRGIISLQHSTIFDKAELPSSPMSVSYFEPIVYASLGYVGVSNDFVGYGTDYTDLSNTGYHIYDVTGSDWLKFMQATNKFIADSNITTSKDLYIVGYSQGGYNALACAKKWETTNSNFFNLKASYCGDGAYMLSTLIDSIFNKPTYEVWDLMHCFTMSYVNRYGNGKSEYADMYLSRYADSIEGWYNAIYNSSMTEETLKSKFSNNKDSIFTQEFITAMKNKSNSFYQWVKNNDLPTNFAPKHSIYLFHSKGDDYIPYAIAEETFSKLVANGASDVSLFTSLSSAGHQLTYMEFMRFVSNDLADDYLSKK